MTNTTKLPTIFWIISVLAVIWNAIGVFTLYDQVFISEEALAELPDAERTLYENIPSWLNIIYGLAVVGGLLGSVALLMRKGWAVTLFLISLVCVVIQMAYSLFMTNSIEVYGAVSVVMAITVTAIAIFLYYYSMSCRTKGWLV